MDNPGGMRRRKPISNLIAKVRCFGPTPLRPKIRCQVATI